MIRSIHYSWLLPKQLEGLRKAGRKAELAAEKCEIILNDISKYGCQCETVLSKRTRNGEARIKNCVKYDLGGGYRLVTVRAENHLFISFIGSHDDTDQWIEHHRYDIFRPSLALYRCEERAIQPAPADMGQGEVTEAVDLSDEYEEQLMARLDESHLRAIFQGLCSSSDHIARNSTATGPRISPAR